MNKKVIFTDSAKDRLVELHRDVDSMIEDYVREEKYVPGEDIIEITASDVDGIAKRVGIRSKRNSLPMTRGLSVIYLVLGVMTSVAGLFYNQIQELVREGNQTQLLLLLGGSAMMVAGAGLYYVLRAREIRSREIEIRAIASRRQRTADDPSNERLLR
jgi:hypothetical protein